MNQRHIAVWGLALWLIAAGLSGCTRASASDLSPTPALNGQPTAAAQTSGASLAKTPDAVSVATVASTATAAPIVLSPKLVGYLPSAVSSRKFPLNEIPVGQLTHLIYAFYTISTLGECVPADPAADAANLPGLKALRLGHPALQLLVSIGGYSHSGRFSDAALTATSRRRFAQSCVKLMQQNGFDGLDVDWEFPVSGGQPANSRRAADRGNFSLLLGELRGQLDALGNSNSRRYLLTMAAPAGPPEYANLELDSLNNSVDWFNLMAYDFYGAASTRTNFAAPLFRSPDDPASDDLHRMRYNADAAVKAYRAAGVPAAKLLLGVPFYGYGWTGVGSANHGLYQRPSGTVKGTWGGEGTLDYRDLAQNYLKTYARYWNNDTQAPWLYNAKSGIMITYDDEQSLGLKADYARANGLGGVMIWQIAADDAEHTLLNALHAHLGP